MKPVGDLESGCDDTKRARLNGETGDGDGLASWSFLPRFLPETGALLLPELLQEAAVKPLKSIPPGFLMFCGQEERASTVSFGFRLIRRGDFKA
jgi:hypothetical protein